LPRISEMDRLISSTVNLLIRTPHRNSATREATSSVQPERGGCTSGLPGTGLRLRCSSRVSDEGVAVFQHLQLIYMAFHENTGIPSMSFAVAGTRCPRVYPRPERASITVFTALSSSRSSPKKHKQEGAPSMNNRRYRDRHSAPIWMARRIIGRPVERFGTWLQQFRRIYDIQSFFVHHRLKEI
jgi:hypothetical protein